MNVTEKDFEAFFQATESLMAMSGTLDEGFDEEAYAINRQFKSFKRRYLKAKEAIFKVNKNRIVTILHKQLMKIENIKFKAKRLDNGEWVKGNLRTSKSDNAMIIPIEYSGTFPVDPYTICQFTGLTDCEGNEVWEGDIIKNHDFPFEKRTVTWANCLSCFIPIDEDGAQDRHLSLLVLFKKWTVIGNKFDKEE